VAVTQALTIVSVDSHAGPPTTTYRAFLDRQYHEAFDEYLDNRQQATRQISKEKGFAIFTAQYVDEFYSEPQVVAGGCEGAWDPDKRRAALLADGVVAEVIFPGPASQHVETSIPFQGQAFFGDFMTKNYPLDFTWAGARAYNRWIASFHDRSWQAPIALIPTLADIDAAVSEIRWARTQSFGGVMLRQTEYDLPALFSPQYDPIWQACVDEGLPVHFHCGTGLPDNLRAVPSGAAADGRGQSDEARLVASIETHWFGYRPLWHLIFGGVLERHPSLRVVFTEAQAAWVPGILKMLDARCKDEWTTFRDHITRLPSEFWQSQCLLGGSFLSDAEVQMRHEIGIGTLMWGNDYPHIEGCWPRSREWLAHSFRGCPENEVRAILGATAIQLYGFDPGALAGAAQSWCPTVEEVTQGAPATDEFLASRHGSRVARSPLWVMGGSEPAVRGER
jgi:predicted TIM-barrel fold metal-dependent hydrolase